MELASSPDKQMGATEVRPIHATSWSVTCIAHPFLSKIHLSRGIIPVGLHNSLAGTRRAQDGHHAIKPAGRRASLLSLWAQLNKRLPKLSIATVPYFQRSGQKKKKENKKKEKKEQRKRKPFGGWRHYITTYNNPGPRPSLGRARAQLLPVLDLHLLLLQEGCIHVRTAQQQPGPFTNQKPCPLQPIIHHGSIRRRRLGHVRDPVLLPEAPVIIAQASQEQQPPRQVQIAIPLPGHRCQHLRRRRLQQAQLVAVILLWPGRRQPLPQEQRQPW